MQYIYVCESQKKSWNFKDQEISGKEVSHKLSKSPFYFALNICVCYYVSCMCMYEYFLQNLLSSSRKQTINSL